jgi:hypothetical protein
MKQKTYIVSPNFKHRCMNNSRRSFLKQTSLIAAGAALAPDLLFAAQKKPGLPVFNYILFARYEKNPLGTLQALAKMGTKRRTCQLR